MSRILQVLAPGLLGPWPAAQMAFVCEGLSAPSLTTLLARGRRAPGLGGDDSLAGALFETFGHAPGEGWPVAAVTHLMDGVDTGSSGWIRADPVHLSAASHGAGLRHGPALELDDDDAAQLIAALDGLRAPGAPQALTAHRWYLPIAIDAQVITRPPASLSGRSRESLLPSGPDGRAWRGWLTEAQMMLHTAPVNERREARGLAPVNSVWLWGAGVLPVAHEVDFEFISCADPVALGLASHHQVTPLTVTADGADALLEQAGEGTTLAVVEAACGHPRTGGVEPWRSAVEAFEVHWATPLLESLRCGVVEQVRLLCPPAPAITVSRASLWRLWRRPGTLAGHMLEEYQ